MVTFNRGEFNKLREVPKEMWDPHKGANDSFNQQKVYLAY